MAEQKPSGNGPFAHVRQDALASLVVFLVALPLCMGISIASGAPVAAGLVTGIIGGIIVGLLAGAPLQVSGPAAGLTVVCAEVIADHGLAAMGIVVLLSGVMQLVAGLSKLGQWFRAVSPAVIRGMLAGIGVLIVSSQFHVMLDDKPAKGGLANLLSIPEAIRKGLPLPKTEDRETRQFRLELLQTFGVLHERQIEIADHIGRLVSPHEVQTDEYVATQLQPFIPRQQSLLDDFREIREKLENQPKHILDGEKGAALSSSVQQARRSLTAALADMEGKPLDQVAASQQQAAGALGEVLAGLKNHDWAAKVGLMSIAIIIIWQSLAPMRLRVIPGPLLAVAFVTLVAWAGSLPVLYVEVPDRLLDGLTFPAMHVFSDVPLQELLGGALFMAVSASAQTLLCASALDRIQTGPQTQYDKELAAHGFGNILCGMFGALPIAGVIVRSAANVQAGARTRLATILHGLWLLIFVVCFASMLRLIPTAALAGILVYTGSRLIDFKGFLRMWQQERTEAVIFLITLGVIVVQDLLVGVATGFVLSAIKLLVRFTRLDVRLIPMTSTTGEEGTTVRIAGAATFLRLPVLAKKLEEVPSEGDVQINTDRLVYIDEACTELLQDWVRLRESHEQRVLCDRRRLQIIDKREWNGAETVVESRRSA
jgi:MFS superfamily sulfate permease-like transporter